MACWVPVAAGSSTPVGIVDHHARSSDHASDLALIEARGFDVIYGDTDSTFVWLKGAHSEEAAARIGRELVNEVNQWWRQHLETTMGLDSALELQFETHYRRFLMPTIRGTDEGSKKRYAGLVRRAEGQEEMVYKGLESVRTDWSPLARQFQQELYGRIFRGQPYRDYVCDFVRRTLAGEQDDLLVYRKRLRRPLADYQRNVPRMCAPRAWPMSTTAAWGERSSTRTAAGSATSSPRPVPSRWKTSSLRSITSITCRVSCSQWPTRSCLSSVMTSAH